MVRQHQMRPIADVEPPFNVHAVAHQLVDFLEERVGIEHDAVPDSATHARVQDPARNLVKHDRRVADVHRVPRVRPALVAHDPVRALGEHVDELALALVPPLRTDDDHSASPFSEHLDPEALSAIRRQLSATRLYG